MATKAKTKQGTAMKFSCLQEELQKGLNIVGIIVVKRTTLPGGGMVLISTDEDRLRLETINLEQSSTCWIRAKVEEKGAILMPFEMFKDFIGSLENNTIEFHCNGAPSNRMNIKSGRWEANISGINPDNFPKTPEVIEASTVQVRRDMLIEGLDYTSFAASRENSRPILTGICIRFITESLIMAGADGFRLAIYKMVLETPMPISAEIVVPATTLEHLKSILKETDEEIINIGWNAENNRIIFRLKDIQLISSLIGGSFPKYDELIPKGFETRLILNIHDFLQAVKLANIFAREEAGAIRLIVDGTASKLTIFTKSQEVGDNNSEVYASVEGPDGKIGIKGKYIFEMLNSMKNLDNIAMEMNNPSSPVVFRSVDSDKYLHVLMPIFLQW